MTGPVLVALVAGVAAVRSAVRHRRGLAELLGVWWLVRALRRR